jgi:Holliday junction resolvasome RuvABC endonuclease subunit
MSASTLTLPAADPRPPTIINSNPRRPTGDVVILCLDLGMKTGWALQDDGTTVSGTAEFRPGRFDGGGMRYLRFRQWLSGVASKTSKAVLIGKTGIDVIYFEEVRSHAGTDAAHAYGGFLAILTAWCEQQCVPYHGVPVGTIKRHVTGKGNAGKPEVIAAVRALGFKPGDDNEADALAILHWALSTRGGVA